LFVISWAFFHSASNCYAKAHFLPHVSDWLLSQSFYWAKSNKCCGDAEAGRNLPETLPLYFF